MMPSCLAEETLTQPSFSGGKAEGRPEGNHVSLAGLKGGEGLRDAHIDDFDIVLGKAEMLEGADENHLAGGAGRAEDLHALPVGSGAVDAVFILRGFKQGLSGRTQRSTVLVSPQVKPMTFRL